jgi:hypothetical protein
MLVVFIQVKTTSLTRDIYDWLWTQITSRNLSFCAPYLKRETSFA